MLEQFLNKKCLVIYTDPFDNNTQKAFGVLVEIEDGLINIQRDNGTFIAISQKNIEKIKEVVAL